LILTSISDELIGWISFIDLIPDSDCSVTSVFPLCSFKGGAAYQDRVKYIFEIPKKNIARSRKKPLHMPETDCSFKQHKVAIGCFWPNFSKSRLLY
jgi:hypothetical protein